MSELLPVVDKAGTVIGTADKAEIYRKGLLHPQIHVWVLTPEKEFIFQHRAPNKKIYPDLLDVTVGGHVEIGETYEAAALRELTEETGIVATSVELIHIATTMERTVIGELINHPRKEIYVLSRLVPMSSLTIEEDKNLEFTSFSLTALKALTDHDRARFAPTIIDRSGMERLTLIHAALCT